MEDYIEIITFLFNAILMSLKFLCQNYFFADLHRKRPSNCSLNDYLLESASKATFHTHKIYEAGFDLRPVGK